MFNTPFFYGFVKVFRNHAPIPFLKFTVSLSLGETLYDFIYRLAVLRVFVLGAKRFNSYLVRETHEGDDILRSPFVAPRTPCSNPTCSICFKQRSGNTISVSSLMSRRRWHTAVRA